MRRIALIAPVLEVGAILVGAILFFLIGAAFAGSPAAVAGGRTYITPEDESDSLPILMDGKVRTYYSIGVDDPIRVSVAGPTTLTLLVRLVFTPQMPDTAAYGIVVSEGSTQLEKHWTSTRRGDDAFVPSSPNKPGLSRKLSVEIPAGSHTVTIALLGETARAAAARFYVPGEFRPEPYASIAPLDARKPVTAIVDEKQITYYLVGQDTSLTVRIVWRTKRR